MCDLPFDSVWCAVMVWFTGWWGDAEPCIVVLLAEYVLPVSVVVNLTHPLVP